MEMWKSCTLSDLGEIVGGGTPSTKVQENYENGTISWITPKDLAGLRRRFISQGERNITEQGLRSCSAQMMPKGTILFSSRAPIGYVAIANNELCTNQGFKSIVPNAGTDSLFLYYLLVYNKNRIENVGIGTTFKEVSAKTMRGISVRVPTSIIYQKHIADILSMLDERIEYNQAINKNLEEQARAIFDLFYSRAVEKVPFTQLIKVLGGGTPKTTEGNFWNGDIPFFTPKDIGAPYSLRTEKYITEAGLANCNSRLYPVNTTFVTARGTVGKVSLAGVPMAMNQSCYALANDEIHPLLTYFYTLNTVRSLRLKATGAVFDAIITADFERELLNKLSYDESSQVLSHIVPMMESIHKNSIGIARLSELRDALLPRLMLGELDVSNIEL